MRKLKWIAYWLACAMALSACGAGSNVRPVPCPELPPPPAEVMVPAKADFVTKMRDFLFEKPSEPTPSRDD